MESITQKVDQLLKHYAPLILRIGLALVVVWFGSQQLLHTSEWLSYIPDSIIKLTHFTANTLVHINGAFEIVFGLALLFGIEIRLVAFLLMLHMFDITVIVGYDQIGVRDFGLAMSLLALFMLGSGKTETPLPPQTPPSSTPAPSIVSQQPPYQPPQRMMSDMR